MADRGKRKYKHWWTYWVLAVLDLFIAGMQMYVAVYQTRHDLRLLSGAAATIWLVVAAMQIYWYFRDRKAA